MTQFEFYKSFLFVAELIIAELLFLGKLKKKPYFILRTVGCCVLTSLVAFLLPTGGENPFYCAFLFAAIFGVTIIGFKLCFDEAWFTVLFCCFAGYTTQHFSYELYNVLVTLFTPASSTNFYGQASFIDIFPNLFVFAMYLSVYVLCYFVSYLLFGTAISKEETAKLEKNFVFVFAVVVFAVDVLLNAFVVYDSGDAGKYGIIISVYNLLCCAIALYLQFEFAARKRIENEFDTMRSIWRMQKKQYELSKRNIEIINMKCHDLKHQIHSVGVGEKISAEALKDLESHVTIYDSVAKTGNDALDVVLTEKSLLCAKEKINFGYIADGSKLGFMKKADVYALFGNILDNAIEAVTKLDEANRIISLKVKASGNILIVNAFNYYSGEIVVENGVIATIKKDKNSHGFGLKSIRYICAKYDGDVQITTENNVFNLNVLFPLPHE